MIPEGWKQVKIGEIGKVVTGSTPSTKQPEFYDGDIPFVAPGDLGFSKYVIDAEKTLTEAGRKVSRLIPAGATLFTCIGSTIGKIGIAGMPLTTNQQINAVIPDNGHNNEFIYYQLARVASRIARLAGTQAVPIVSKKQFAAEKILVAPSSEQKRIREVLETWDRAIETVEALIANARAQKQALMQQLLPQGTTPPRKRLPGFSGEWRKLHIGDVTKEISERAGEETTFPVLSCSKYDGMVESLTYFKKKVYSDNTSNYKVMRRGTFGFPSNHIEEGSIGYQDLFDAGIVSPIYRVFAANAQVDDGFLYKLLKTDRYRQIFAAATNASVDRRGSLRWKEFSRIKLPLPPLDEQEAIDEAVNSVAATEAAYKTQLAALRREKAALMQQLLTGKRRVKLDDDEVAA